MSTGCAICEQHADQAGRGLVAWEDDLWLLRHHPSPAPLVGWLLLDAKRHVDGAASFNSAEQSAFGAVLQRACAALRSASGCERVYTIAFGESAHHFHMHLVPRSSQQKGTSAWEVADFYREVVAERIAGVEQDAAASMVSRLARLLAL
ncbi:MAG: diadenosine tetraphosphate hydrolase [Phycisphaerales bacterium]|nr:diadenosine tetraphosphate hydrolase [Phycisphaerales bacterium]